MRSPQRPIGSLLVGVLLAAPLGAQVTQRVSIGARGKQAHAPCTTQFTGANSITADGRFVLFSSVASDLVPGDTNGKRDLFVRDRWKGTIERVDVGSSGAEANADSYGASISADGRFVVFTSLATNLVPGDTNGCSDVFLRDRVAGTTERVSLDSAGNQGDDASAGGQVSADGRFVAFASFATDLVPNDTNDVDDLFVHDCQTGATERVNVASNGSQAVSIGEGGAFSISADGRFVAFLSDAANLVPGDTNFFPDVFVHDRQSGVTERVSVSSTGEEQNATWGWEALSCSLSADGRWVVFDTPASNLVPGDHNDAFDVFVHDRWTGETERASVDSNGIEGDRGGVWCSISADGRYVAFESLSTTLDPADTNAFGDIFLRDRVLGTTERVSVGSAGEPGDANSGGMPSVTPDGRYVAFSSVAKNLVPGDSNQCEDVFVRDRTGGTSFEALCEPGIDGVIGCPCENDPTRPGHGCDNAAGTGGAALTASGGTFLSSDSLVLRTNGEPPDALSFLVQGKSVLPTGAVYGQGVRCVGGTRLRTLFTGHATGGSIQIPSAATGDAGISARSAAQGDTIEPGGSRSYFVVYRDPVVPGTCPSSSTFNATETGLVVWAP